MKSWRSMALLFFVAAAGWIVGFVAGHITIESKPQTFAQEMCEYCVKEVSDAMKDYNRNNLDKFVTNCKLLCEVAAKEAIP